MDKRKKLFIKSLYESNKKKRAKYLGNKKDIETVLKLNIKKYPYIKNSQSLKNSKNKSKTITVNKEEQKDKNEEFNTLTFSIRKLKTFYPNIKDEVFNENYTNGHIPTRTEHINYEKNLKSKIDTLSNKENELKQRQTNLGISISNLDKIIDDQRLSIDVILDLDNNSFKLQKMFTEKIINEKSIEKDKRANYINTKEFKDQLNLFLLREEHNSKQKAKEISDSLEENKKEKNEKLKELNKVNELLKNIHANKKRDIDELYFHYLNLLKEGIDTRNEGLSWIIKEIFKMDKKVIISYFPKFLDKQGIQYLFDITHINMKISEIENQIKISKKEFKDQGLVNKKIKFETDFLTERKRVARQSLKIIQQEFTHSFNHNKNLGFNTLKNFSQNAKLVSESDQNNKENNNLQILNQMTKNFINPKTKLIKKLNIDDEHQKKEQENNLPYIDGDPNHIMGGKEKEVNYTNKLVKEEVEATFKIPPLIRLKDYDKIPFVKNHFTSNDIIKINNFFELRKKLSKLREEKDKMKTNEMDRIFKEFQRNNYEKKYNADKLKVISALIGEDNISNELFRQEKREKKYFAQISKSQLHANQFLYRTFRDKLNKNKDN